MHCHAELQRDLGYAGGLPDDVLMRWFADRYSTSKHLLTLDSLARGLVARRIAEVGFGRSSFVLARAAIENSGQFATCDICDFSYLLNDEERAVTTFFHGSADQFWPQLMPGLQLVFLDCFSDESRSAESIATDLDSILHDVVQGGVIAVHDACDPRYATGRALRHLANARGAEVEVSVLPYNYGLGLVRRVAPSPYGEVTDSWQKKATDSPA